MNQTDHRNDLARAILLALIQTSCPRRELAQKAFEIADDFLGVQKARDLGRHCDECPYDRGGAA